MIFTFHKNHQEKPMATSFPLNSAPRMAKPSVKFVKPSTKQKWGHLTSPTKRAKEWDIRQWGFSFPVLVRLEGFFINSVSFGRDAHSVLFSNFVSFGRDVRSASSFNSAGFYLWVTHCHYTRHLKAVHCHCILYLWVVHCYRSSGFPPQSFIRLGGFLSD